MSMLKKSVDFTWKEIHDQIVSNVISQSVRRYKNLAHLSESRLSDILGVSRSFVSHLLSGSPKRIGGTKLLPLNHILTTVGSSLDECLLTRSQSRQVALLAFRHVVLKATWILDDVGKAMANSDLLVRFAHGNELSFIIEESNLRFSEPIVRSMQRSLASINGSLVSTLLFESASENVGALLFESDQQLQCPCSCGHSYSFMEIVGCRYHVGLLRKHLVAEWELFSKLTRKFTINLSLTSGRPSIGEAYVQKK